MTIVSINEAGHGKNWFAYPPCLQSPDLQCQSSLRWSWSMWEFVSYEAQNLAGQKGHARGFSPVLYVYPN